MYSATSMLAKAKDNNILPVRRNNFYYREVYLKSDHWKLLREEKLNRNPTCQQCGSSVCLDVHHKDYRGLYDVRLNDLQTLCRKCHNKKHKRKDHKKPKRNLIERIKWHAEGYGNPVKLTARNKERQEVFDKMVNWRCRDINTYISIHY